VATTPRQRQIAADALRAGRTQVEAALAAGIGISTLKRWLKNDPEFQAVVVSSPDIRPGLPPRLGGERGVLESQRDLRCRMWLAAGCEVLGSYIPPAAFEAADSVLHVHRVEPDAVDSVVASIGASAYPADSPYIPVPLAGLNELLENLPLVACRRSCNCQSRGRPRACSASRPALVTLEV
jgi:transposase